LYIGLCFDKKKCKDRVGFSVSCGAIEMMDQASCERKEIAVLRAMKGAIKLAHCRFL
jgi:hypothetical protein